MKSLLKYTRIFSFCLGLCFIVFTAAAQSQPLWQIGSTDTNDSEFALARGDYTNFVQNFGGADHAFYVGLSDPQTDWPCILPGPMDGWAGSSHNNRNHNEWDQMNTLPIGFVLDQVQDSGNCILTISFCDSSPKTAPCLRVTINGTIFERDLSLGGNDRSLDGDFSMAKPQTIQVPFPASLLKRGYNEIALRSTSGSWCLFDTLRLDAPAGVILAPSTQTIIRSVSAPPYAVSSKRKTRATVRVEVYRGGSVGNLNVQIGSAPVQTWQLQPGLQVLEIPAPASKKGTTTHIRLSTDGQSLYETDLDLYSSAPVTPSDYVDVFTGTAHSRWMIAPGHGCRLAW